MKKPAARSSYFLASASLLSALATHGQEILFFDNFNGTPAAAWNVNASTANDRAVFLFDYGTLGIPSAPRSGSSHIGVMLQANRPVGAGALSGVSISPVGQHFTGDYEVRYDLWQNFPGPFPAGGTGSTQLTGAGIMTAGNVATFAGAGDGLWFAATGDGGSTLDYRGYVKGANQSTTSTAVNYAAGSQAESAAYYNTFGNVSAPPAAQLTLNPTPTGNTAVGSLGMAWHDVRITKIGNTVTWAVDGKLIATADIAAAQGVAGSAFGGDNILFAQADINATQTTTALDPLLFGLIDNVTVVTVVPEPSTYALMGTGALLLLARARRALKR
jgi:hypothetical protein